MGWFKNSRRKRQESNPTVPTSPDRILNPNSPLNPEIPMSLLNPNNPDSPFNPNNPNGTWGPGPGNPNSRDLKRTAVTDVGGTPGTLLYMVDQANLDRTGVTTLVIDQDVPLGVAVDNRIYWADNGRSIRS